MVSPRTSPRGNLSVEEVVHDPNMHSVFLKYLSVADTTNFSRLLFLVSVDEYKKLFLQPTNDMSLRVNYAKKIISKYMTEDSFFNIGSEDLTVHNQPIATFGTYLKNDLNMCTGLCSSDDLFQDVQKSVIEALKPSLKRFQETPECKTLMRFKVSMIDTTIPATNLHDVEIDHTKANFTLERVLSNRRLCCVFWVYLFKERSHGPLSFWMEATMRLLPLMDDYLQTSLPNAAESENNPGLDLVHSQAVVHLSHVLWRKYMAPHATAEVHVLCEGQRALFDVLEHHFASWNRDELLTESQVQQAAMTLRSILCYVKDDLQMNHFVRFLQSKSFQSMLHSYQHRLMSPSHQTLSVATLKEVSSQTHSTGSCDSSSSSSDSSSTSLPELFHCMNVISHQPQRPRLTSFALQKVGGAPHCISGVLSFTSNLQHRGTFTQSILYSLANVYPQDDIIAHHHTLPDHLEGFFSPLKPTIRSTTPPPPSLLHVVIGSTERPFYMACLKRYVPITATEYLNPLESVLLEEKSLCVYVAAGICLLSRYPLFDTLRKRLQQVHEAVVDIPEYNTLEWNWSSRYVAQLAAPIPASPSPFPQSHSIDFSIKPLFDCLHIENLLLLFASFFLERKILFVSSYISVLTTVAEACKTLLAPLQWPHVYAPLLPPNMLECLHCPTPFVFGVHSSMLESVNGYIQDDEEAIVVINLDSHEVLHAPMSLPSTVHRKLAAQLKELILPDVVCSDMLAKPRCLAFPQDAVRNLFRTTWSDMMANMEEFSFPLSDEVDSMVVFDNVGFLKGREATESSFYQIFVKTQLFSQYIATNGVQS
ncbi:hypothetical protein THRCLA_08539 [Thraustotheca clavata]|uniref:UDENN domain-containing protein n=1 Tax=Thraustotheca clavata TaxID=74557 RepID=A0A1V9Z552_9STRA|nr:hypothetical protein THRCLA_08539 [Thraustotheca clavata]